MKRKDVRMIGGKGRRGRGEGEERGDEGDVEWWIGGGEELRGGGKED